MPRIPDVWVDPIQNPGQGVSASSQQPLETAAEICGLDLASICGAHRGQAVCVEQAGLDERDQPIEFDPVDRKEPRWQPQLGKHSGRKEALISEVMNGEDRRDMTGEGRARRQICRGEPGMPVVDVQDIGAPAGIGAARKFCGDPAEEPEPSMIVGPIVPVRTGIGIARPIVEPRLVDQVSQEFRSRYPG